MQEFWVFLSDTHTFSLFINLVLGAFAVFFAILAWRKTNEAYMIFFILGILFHYAEVLYKTINHFGFIGGQILSIQAISMGLAIVESLPTICFIISLLLFLKSKRF